MADRYGRPYAPRPRSPPLFNAARASLPINISSYAPPEGHLHAVPSSRREVITAPRSAASTSTTNGGTVTTTYKIKADGPQRGSSAREGSRTRRSNTLDNGAARPVIPTIVTETQRHRPVVHSGARPASPMKNAYRSSEEEYVSIPATSRHEHHHRKRYSAHLDSGDISRLGNEREGRLRVAPVREPAYTTRSRPAYASTVVRHPDNVAADYGDNGYGYTKPGDLAQYDLDHNEPVHHRPRRDSFESGRSRPTSITGYGDLILRNHEGRERGPPPSTRGFHKIRAPTWDQPTVRMPVPPSPMESVHRPAPFDSIEPPRRSNSRVRTSAYHDREPRRGPREEIYEIKDDQRRREHRRDTYDDAVEQRGFGIRPERVERSERPVERSDRSERPERVERSEVERPREKEHRPERIEPERPREKDHRPEKPESERPREKEHKGKEALTAGLSLAGAALGINAVKNAVRGDDREDRDDREERRRDKEESRRDRDDRGIDLSGRDPKERHSDAPPRKITPPRDTPSPREADSPDLRDRDPKERRSREDKSERRRSRHAEQAVDSRSSEDTSASEEAPTGPRPRRRNRDSNAQAFNPKDTMDLKALKEALNSKENAPKANTGETRARTPRESTTKDSREAAEVRKDLKSSEDRDRRPREPLASTEPNMKPRVVSPPRTTEEKDTSRPPVVKGILRQPREKFPEDPAPIREGVAPLKDSKRDGIPPDARWTKISRRLVNPEALEAGKERFEAREDFVIVLRVLSKEEVQGYAEVTQRIRAAREEVEEVEAQDRRAARRARHEKHKREQSERERTGESSHRPRREHRKSRHPDDKREKESDSGSDSTDSDTDDDRVRDRPRMLEAPKKKPTFDGAIMSGGLGSERAVDLGHLKETGNGVYTGYVRNPPPPVLSGAGRKERD